MKGRFIFLVYILQQPIGITPTWPSTCLWHMIAKSFTTFHCDARKIYVQIAKVSFIHMALQGLIKGEMTY